MMQMVRAGNDLSAAKLFARCTTACFAIPYPSISGVP